MKVFVKFLVDFIIQHSNPHGILKWYSPNYKYALTWVKFTKIIVFLNLSCSTARISHLSSGVEAVIARKFIICRQNFETVIARNLSLSPEIARKMSSGIARKCRQESPEKCRQESPTPKVSCLNTLYNYTYTIFYAIIYLPFSIF